ncbi:MAG: MATE family efflux transporter [Bacteroides sp.]|nr:MATE family efflux transporter [Bacteroides sp.]MCM1379896.1 MATE family efflux transporter [Bacteroides sp.]MCM1446250.1 MATE family efflux transporter [Prevotella sp.]
MQWNQYWSYYKQIARLGLPIVVGQAGMIIVGFADNIMVGRYTTEALSAASFVNNTFNMANLACMGFTYGITPLVGALLGRGENNRIGKLMRTAVVINLLYTLLVGLLMGILYLNLDCLGQPEELLPLIKPYYLLALIGLLPMTLYNVWAQCSYGMKGTRMPMWIILGANLLNVCGNYLLIYGNFGFPEMGLFGAGLATFLARLMSAVVIIVMFLIGNKYADVRRGYSGSRINSATFSILGRTSLPVSLQLFFETAAFSGAAIFVGWLGATELAAFQVMVIIGTLGFCFYYSLGSATSVLVANAAGLGDHHAMRRIGFAGYHLTLLMAVCASLTFLLGGRHLIEMFTPDPAVIAVALALIPPLLCYQLGDATQVNFANALRGTSRVMPMLWIAFCSYVVVGLPSTYLFGFTFGGGIVGIFYSFSVSLFLAGALFLKFFLKYTRPRE